MKKLSIALATAGLVLASAGTLRLQAQGIFPMSLSFKLTVQVQDLDVEQVGTSPVFKSTIAKIKVTNKEILSLLEVAYGTNFVNTFLVMDDNYGSDTDGHFMILDEFGNLLRDATADGFLSAFFDTSSDSVFTGQQNDDTGAQKYTDIFVNEITFTDDAHTNWFNFYGQAQFSASVDAVGSWKDSLKMTGAGSGEVETPPDAGSGIPLMMVSGSLSGKASGH